MRALVLLFMIALLPLRAWLGDSMAMQVDTEPTVLIEMIAASADTTRAGASFYVNTNAAHLPCHDQASAMGQTSELSTSTPDASDDLTIHSDCAECSVCVVCHSVALSTAINLFPVLALPTHMVQSGQALFASVPRAPQLKPPIA